MSRALIGWLLLGLVCACGGDDTSDPLDVFSVIDVAGQDVFLDSGIEDGIQSEDVADSSPADSGDEDLPDLFVPPVPCEVGEYCDDGDPCTYEDQCVDGLCEGTTYSCDDQRSCTVDLCDGYGGCAAEVASGHCLINNLCYEAGESGLFNECIQCVPGENTFAFSFAEDGSSCGLDDPCLTEGLCVEGVCDGEATGCDDQNPCTDDRCDALEGCVYEPNFDLCEDGDPCSLGDQCEAGSCVSGLLPLDCDDQNLCTVDLCTPLGCEHAPASIPCSDGDFCTEGDSCVDGTCTPGPLRSCNDGNDCTNDACNSVAGCVHELLDNTCCVGSVHVCNDGNSCTIDNCDPEFGDCSYELATGPCNDGDACTGSDNCNSSGLCLGEALGCDDGNPCTMDSCSPDSGCSHSPGEGSCDDGNACTESDVCYGLGQCAGIPVICDDGNSCTLDQCSAISGCLHQSLDGSCTDGNSCTLEDTCVGGQCIGLPLDCTDGNPCTTDNCHPAIGCNHLNVAGSCDDGSECTVNDQCNGGVCQGEQVELCCTPEFTGPSTKLTFFAIGDAGVPGMAVDVDSDPSTCSPQGNCDSGKDNSLAAFAALANEPLAEEVESGGIIALIEHSGFNTDGLPYTMNFWEGKKVEQGCDIQNQSCDYWVKDSAVSADCVAMFGFDNALYQDGQVSAGGLGYSYPVLLKIGGADVALELLNARLEGQLSLVGDQPGALVGVIGGAVSKAQLATALSAIPDDELPDGISKQALLTLVNILIKNDIDLDSDGVPDAASIGIQIEGIVGNIAGLEP